MCACLILSGFLLVALVHSLIRLNVLGFSYILLPYGVVLVYSSFSDSFPAVIKLSAVMDISAFFLPFSFLLSNCIFSAMLNSSAARDALPVAAGSVLENYLFHSGFEIYLCKVDLCVLIILLFFISVIILLYCLYPFFLRLKTGLCILF